MDFIAGLLKFKGYEAIFVVVDRLSKYCHFIPLKHPYTARSLAEIFSKEVVKLHGIPMSIVSDRDPIFMSNFWRELFKAQGTQLKMSSSYHPEKPSSRAKLREMAGNDIFGDGKAENRDNIRGARRPPGGGSSIALV